MFTLQKTCGAVIGRRKSLRGVLAWARQRKPVAVYLQTDNEDVGATVYVDHADRSFAVARFADWQDARAWVARRRWGLRETGVSYFPHRKEQPFRIVFGR